MFSSITNPNYPKAALGIEARGVSAVAVQGNSRRGFSVKQAASLELPQGLITPSFLEPNISNTAEFSACLQDVVEMAGLLKQKQWSATLPGGSARTAILALDSEPASRKEAEEVLDWKAEQTFGAPAAEMRLARQKISPDAEGRIRYFTTAITLAVMDEYESQFERLGWKVGLILPRAVGEASWLMDRQSSADSLLISENSDGFTALLLRGDEPAVVRSVTCTPSEVDDEIYRLVMFYNDRFGDRQGSGMLEKLLVIGKSLVTAEVQTIASDALGQKVNVLSHHELGLDFPDSNLTFHDIAAPAGLAALGA